MPDQKNEEVVGLGQREVGLSEMERGFGEQPLEVSSGVAVTEEGVVLHVADLITKF